CSGDEHITDPNTEDRLEDAWFSRDGNRIVLAYQRADPDGHFHYLWPENPFIPPGQKCAGPISALTTFGDSEVRFRFRTVPTNGGSLSVIESPPQPADLERR